MDRREKLNELTDEELAQICGAAKWYASFHARMIAEGLDDPSAMAVGRRERYKALISGLRKLGVRVHDPTVPVTSIVPDRDDAGGRADTKAA